MIRHRWQWSTEGYWECRPDSLVGVSVVDTDPTTQNDEECLGCHGHVYEAEHEIVFPLSRENPVFDEIDQIYAAKIAVPYCPLMSEATTILLKEFIDTALSLHANYNYCVASFKRLTAALQRPDLNSWAHDIVTAAFKRNKRVISGADTQISDPGGAAAYVANAVHGVLRARAKWVELRFPEQANGHMMSAHFRERGGHEVDVRRHRVGDLTEERTLRYDGTRWTYEYRSRIWRIHYDDIGFQDDDRVTLIANGPAIEPSVSTFVAGQGQHVVAINPLPENVHAGLPSAIISSQTPLSVEQANELQAAWRRVYEGYGAPQLLSLGLVEEPTNPNARIRRDKKTNVTPTRRRKFKL